MTTIEFKVGDEIETYDRALWSKDPARGVVIGFDNTGPDGSQRVICRFKGGSQRAPMLPSEIKHSGS
jgi:hypothetical protein